MDSVAYHGEVWTDGGGFALADWSISPAMTTPGKEKPDAR
jgi:hypothetical protein